MNFLAANCPLQSYNQLQQHGKCCNQYIFLHVSVKGRRTSLQGFAEPLHHAESVKRKVLHITYIAIHTMYIYKHAPLDALHFQHDAKILQNPVLHPCTWQSSFSKTCNTKQKCQVKSVAKGAQYKAVVVVTTLRSQPLTWQ